MWVATAAPEGGGGREVQQSCAGGDQAKFQIDNAGDERVPVGFISWRPRRAGTHTTRIGRSIRIIRRRSCRCKQQRAALSHLYGG